MPPAAEPAPRVDARRAGGILLGVSILVLALAAVDPGAVGRALVSVRPAWVAAAVLTVAITVVLVSVRWRLLLDVRGSLSHYTAIVAAIIVGQTANMVMPFKTGDVLRIGAVSRKLSVAPADVVATVAAERFFDALAACVVAMALAVSGVLPAFAHRALLSLAVVLGAALAAVWLLLRAASTVSAWLLRRRGALVGRVCGAVAAQLQLLERGLSRAARPRTAAVAFIVSLAVVGGSVATAWCVMQASGIAAPAAAAAAVVIVLQIGNAVAPVPGALGVSQVLTMQTLAWWGVDESRGLACALVLYVVSRAPKLMALPFALAVFARETGRAGSDGEPAR